MNLVCLVMSCAILACIVKLRYIDLDLVQLELSRYLDIFQQRDQLCGYGNIYPCGWKVLYTLFHFDVPHLQFVSPVCVYVKQEHIYKLMKSDSYSRFIRSSAYQELLQARKKVHGSILCTTSSLPSGNHGFFFGFLLPLVHLLHCEVEV